MKTICDVSNGGLYHSCGKGSNFSIPPPHQACSGKDRKRESVTALTPDGLQKNPRYTKCGYPEACYVLKVSSTSV